MYIVCVIHTNPVDLVLFTFLPWKLCLNEGSVYDETGGFGDDGFTSEM